MAKPGILKVRAGYTLVELMAALILTVLLVTAVLGVTTRIAGHRRLLEKENPFLPWRDRLTDQLARDFTSCQSIIVRPRQIVMETVDHQYSDSQIARRYPAVVIYSIVELAGRSTIVRMSRNLDSENGLQVVSRNVMCEGVLRFVPMKRLQTDVPPVVLPLKFECGSDGVRNWTTVLVRDGVPR